MEGRLSNDERGRIAEKLMDLANYTVLALGVGQILSQQPNLFAAAVGVFLFVGLYYFAMQIMKRRR